MTFEYYEEYLKTKYYYGSVKKIKFSFSCHLQISKKPIMLKKIQGEKPSQTLIFPKIPSAYKLLKRRNIM